MSGTMCRCGRYQVKVRGLCRICYGTALRNGSISRLVPPTPVERLQRLYQETANGCWEWQGYTDAAGYGQFRLNGRSQKAHRAAYELLVGRVPDGLDLDHLCRNRGCVNPAHLEPVTRSVNVLRSDSPATNRRKFATRSHCRHGHPMTLRNSYFWVNEAGYRCRHCRACLLIRKGRPVPPELLDHVEPTAPAVVHAWDSEDCEAPT